MISTYKHRSCLHHSTMLLVYVMLTTFQYLTLSLRNPFFPNDLEVMWALSNSIPTSLSCCYGEEASQNLKMNSLEL